MACSDKFFPFSVRLTENIWLFFHSGQGQLSWQGQWVFSLKNHFKNCFLKFYLFWEKERESVCTGGAESEGERERIPSRLHTVSVGLEPTNHEIMTWAEIKNQALNWLSHPGTLKKPLLIETLWFQGKGKWIKFEWVLWVGRRGNAKHQHVTESEEPNCSLF